MSRVLPVGRAVTVEVPATSANLGPGFDCFGLAFDWREEVELATVEHGFDIDVTGEGADQVPRDASHLIVRSALLGLADLGVSVPGLRLRCHNTIPHGRGLGSSSAAIVAGLTAAAGLAGVELDRAWLLGHANAIEGHPDNVAAAVYGGFVLAFAGRDGVRAVSARIHPGVTGAVYVAEHPVRTEAARGLLPAQVAHTDAAANTGRAALLVHALAEQPDLLLEGTRDWLHQGFRAPAMPRSYDWVTALRGDGFAAFVSGAGPTVAVLGTADQLATLPEAPHGFVIRLVDVGGPVRIR